jgi:pantetheine-phosphate adenylyltransferase
VIIGIGTNTQKNRYFPLDLMTLKIKEAFHESENISIISYDGLTASIAQQYGAQFLLRGLRNTTDFEYENTISQVNRHLIEDLETVFLITSPELAPISSTIVRELHKFGAKVNDYLPYDLE